MELSPPLDNRIGLFEYAELRDTCLVGLRNFRNLRLSTLVGVGGNGESFGLNCVSAIELIGTTASKGLLFNFPMREELAFGGCGNAEMLTDLFGPFSSTILEVIFGLKRLGVSRLGVGKVGVGREDGDGMGKPVLEGSRDLEGVLGVEDNREKFGDGKLFLVLIELGIGGRAPVGGSKGGCNGIGIPDAIVMKSYKLFDTLFSRSRIQGHSFNP